MALWWSTGGRVGSSVNIQPVIRFVDRVMHGLGDHAEVLANPSHRAVADPSRTGLLEQLPGLDVLAVENRPDELPSVLPFGTFLGRNRRRHQILSCDRAGVQSGHEAALEPRVVTDGERQPVIRS